jgi:hypothetical protein
VPVRAQGHVEQHEQADRDGIEDEASHAGVIGSDRVVVEAMGAGPVSGGVAISARNALSEAGDAPARNHLAVFERVEVQHRRTVRRVKHEHSLVERIQVRAAE